MDKIIPKFRGIKAYEEELAEKSSAEEPDSKSGQQTRPQKRKIIEIDPKLKAESNEKRLKSLKEKSDYDKRQQILVKEAINTGKRINKRIVFDNDLDDGFGYKVNHLLSEEKNKSNDNSTEKSKVKKVKQLFGSDSEDESEDDSDDNKLKDVFDVDLEKKINDKNAEKLIELNSRFAHDSRFRIDERFLDPIKDNEEVDELMIENEKNLHILEEVLGKKLKPIIKSSDKKSNKSPKPGLFVSRFDPTNEKSSEYEVKTTSPEKKSNKKVSFDQKILDKEEVEEEVSKEVYFEVSSSLKDSLSQKEDEFSLTKLFGTSTEESADKTSTEDKNVKPFYDTLDNNQRKTNNSRNPFKYDSSDSEEEEADEEVVIKTKSDPKEGIKSKPNLNGFKFFFDKNDPRLSEDVFWDKKLVQKARDNWKDRQIMIMRAMTVRKKSAKKNEKAKKKTFLKYKNNPSLKRFPKRDNKSDN